MPSVPTHIHTCAFEYLRKDGSWPTNLEVLPASYQELRGYGDVSLLEQACLGIIGARRATPYGLAVARMAGKIAAQSGICVVSGGAMGCDFAAAQEALNAGGKVIIVSGCGPDVIYPRTSREIFERCGSGEGLILSAEPWKASPRRYAFPKRNVIIAALSHSLIVTEAGIKSGTFSTAQAASEFDRAIYAVPGSIFSPNSQGTNRLIEEGAVPIVDEVSLEVSICSDFGALRSMSNVKKGPKPRILEALIAQSSRPDELGVQLDEDVLTVIRTLSDYESKGLVTRLWDGRYSASEKALMGGLGYKQES